MGITLNPTLYTRTTHASMERTGRNLESRVASCEQFPGTVLVLPVYWRTVIPVL